VIGIGNIFGQGGELIPKVLHMDLKENIGVVFVEKNGLNRFLLLM
jgi:hypothetical protein